MAILFYYSKRLIKLYEVGPVEKKIYALRKKHPLVVPQLDPDKFKVTQAKKWLKSVKDLGLTFIALGGSIMDPLHTQELLDIAIDDYDFDVVLYLTANLGSIKGRKDKSAIYWMQVPNSLNSFYNWDGLISTSLQIPHSNLEPIPTVYVFDDRDYLGTSNWIVRSNPIPRAKPEISLAVARAAQYLGIRFYIMAGGSGSSKPPSPLHVSKLATNTSLFTIPTSGITTEIQAKSLFEAGADAIHLGNLLETSNGFKVLAKIVSTAKMYPGKEFI